MTNRKKIYKPARKATHEMPSGLGGVFYVKINKQDEFHTEVEVVMNNDFDGSKWILSTPNMQLSPL